MERFARRAKYIHTHMKFWYPMWKEHQKLDWTNFWAPFMSSLLKISHACVGVFCPKISHWLFIFTDQEQSAKNCQKVKTAQFSWYTIPGQGFQYQWSTPSFLWKRIKDGYLIIMHHSNFHHIVVVGSWQLDYTLCCEISYKNVAVFLFLSHFFDS